MTVPVASKSSARVDEVPTSRASTKGGVKSACGLAESELCVIYFFIPVYLHGKPYRSSKPSTTHSMRRSGPVLPQSASPDGNQRQMLHQWPGLPLLASHC